MGRADDAEEVIDIPEERKQKDAAEDGRDGCSETVPCVDRRDGSERHRKLSSDAPDLRDRVEEENVRKGKMVRKDREATISRREIGLAEEERSGGERQQRRNEEEEKPDGVHMDATIDGSGAIDETFEEIVDAPNLDLSRRGRLLDPEPSSERTPTV